MIISNIIGGLGNQMFQYAVGRRLALHHNVPLLIDISAYATYRLAHYELNHFAIQATPTNRLETLKPKLVKWVPSVAGKRAANQLLVGPEYFHEKHTRFDPTVLNLGDNVYLEGYWQSEKYFADVADQIRKDFTFVGPVSDENQKLLKEIAGKQAVMIHVRRGDYVTNKTFNSILGTCTLEYYHEAIKQVAAKVKNPHFYIFSNDAEWTKENLKLDFPATYVTHNDSSQPQADLQLMSACKHFIIANSTFSWWGAWLSSHSNKIIIAPKKWFNDPGYDATDLVPDSWTRI